MHAIPWCSRLGTWCRVLSIWHDQNESQRSQAKTLQCRCCDCTLLSSRLDGWVTFCWTYVRKRKDGVACHLRTGPGCGPSYRVLSSRGCSQRLFEGLLALILAQGTLFHCEDVKASTFMQGQPISGLKVNKLSSSKTQLPYEYYSLPYCTPDKIISSAENLGEVLRGDRIVNSKYEVCNHLQTNAVGRKC